MKTIADTPLLKSALLGGAALGMLVSGQLQAHAEVGVAAAVNVDARGRPPGAAPRVISLGSNVVFNEEITTDTAGLVQILLLDGTTFTVGPNSQLTIDEFVYDPASGDAKVVATLTKGVFRFVGARTSQKEGGATVKTPVGTIGIRGGVANFSCDGGECKASLVAGKSLTIVDGDGTQRIVYETGYTAVITRSEGGGTTTTVRKSTKEETGLIQQQLASKPGQSGGTTTPPTDETVADSQIAQTNSQLPDTMTVPGSTKPVQSSDPDQAEEVAGIDGKTQDDIDNDIAEEEEQPNARVFTAAAGGYVIDPDNGGGTVPNPGPLGLVGSTPDSDQSVVLTVDGERLKTSNGSLDLPDYSGVTEDEGDPSAPEELYPELDEFVIPVGEATYLGDDLGGYAYAGRGDFVAYLLGINGDMTQPVQVVYGTPSTPAQIDQLRDSSVMVREYALTLDPIQQIPVPLFSADVYGDVSGANSTNLYMVESEGNDPRYFQSWVHISGEGDEQRSAAFLFAGGMFEEGGNLQMSSSRRGTYRSDAYFGPVNMRGGAATRPGATGAHLFGPNVDNFVLGTSVDPADAFNDVPLDYGEIFPNDDAWPYATTHVASLIGERSVTDYGTAAHPVGRTSRDVSGFIAGMGEGFVGDPLFQKESPYVLGSDGSPNLLLSLDAETNQVRASADVFDVLDQSEIVDSLFLRFGPHGGENGGNAFIDDHIFGAQKNNGPENTGIRTDQGSELTHGGSFTPGSYLVSGRANPIPGYQHLEGCESCDFIDWGWWGTRIETDANPGAGVDNERQDFVHMGTWVAGDISTNAEVDAVAGLPAFAGNVSYDGTVVANVVRDTNPGPTVSNASYIATGDLSVNYNFGSRTGTVDIDYFDVNANMPLGVSLDGVIAENSTLQSGLFSGTLTGDNVYSATVGDSLSGNLNGAFVNSSVTPPDLGPNVAAGLVGSFDFTGAGVAATGTMAGVRDLPPP